MTKLITKLLACLPLILLATQLCGCRYSKGINSGSTSEVKDFVAKEIWLTHEDIARWWTWKTEQEEGVKVTRVLFEKITNREAWGYVEYVQGGSMKNVLVSAICYENTYIMVDPLPADRIEHPERYEHMPESKKIRACRDEEEMKKAGLLCPPRTISSSK